MDSVSRQFNLKVFGSPSLTDSNGAVPPALGWGKPLALLCLLAVRSEAPRDEIVDLLWRGVEEANARNAFRQALHRLRSALGEELLPQDRERLGLVRSERITIDLDGFEAAARAGRLDEAIRLYRGDFLEDARLDEPAFDMWADQQRSTLRSRFQRVLESGIGGAESEGRWTDAIEYCHRLLAIAPFEASAALLAAGTLVSAGRRLDALELLRQFGSRLQSDLGLSMPAELQSLLIRLDRQTDQPGRKPSIGTTSAAAPPLLFVGREAELTQLLSLWRTTADDAGALAIVEGELGVGKTRLVRELGRHAKSLGAATVLTGRERANIAQVPFGVFAEALRPLVRAPGIVGASKHLLAEAARLLPELRDSLDLPIVHDVEDEAERVRFFEGVAALVDAAAYEHPLLMVLEDLQYVAPSSLDLLTYLCARLAGSPVMFALTLRATDGPAATVGRLRALAEASDTASPPHGRRALRLVLTPLRRADIATAIGGPAKQLGLSPAVVDRITDRASGIPGRVEELLRRAAAGDDIVTLPVSASALVTERLQRLSSSQRRLFLVMSLIARPAQIRTIAAAAHMTQHAAADSLRVLETEGLVETNEHGSIAAVELPAVTALETAGAASRAFLSGWIAEALAQDPDSPPAELARFFAQAGQTALAFEHARRAAFSALAMGALNEAVASFASARSFAPGPGEQAEIEGILTGLGSGKRRLLSSVRDSTTEAPILTEPAEREGPRAPPTWEGLFPNWRILLGAALATLVISTFVLWRSRVGVAGSCALHRYARRLRGRVGASLSLRDGRPLHGFYPLATV